MPKAHLTLLTLSADGQGGRVGGGGGAIWLWRHVLRLGSMASVRVGP